MAFVIKDLTRETGTCTGSTDPYVLTGAVAGFRAGGFDEVMANLDTTIITVRMGANYEIVRDAVFTAAGGTLSRPTILASSNAGLAVNWSAGTKDIAMGIPAELLEFLNMREIAVASAATCDIGAIQSGRVEITGAVTTTSFGPVKNKLKFVRFSGAVPLTYSATLLLPNGVSYLTTAGEMGVAFSDNTATPIWRYVPLSEDAVRYVAQNRTPAQKLIARLNTSSALKGHLYGLWFQNNAADATNDIDFAEGECASDETAPILIVAAAKTKRLDANWASGTNQGMRNSAAAIADTTYHLYAVSQIYGENPDFYAHTSTVIATVLAALQAESGGSGYIHARRVGSIIRSGATILGFSQVGNEFLLKAPVQNVNTTNPGTGAIIATATVPLGVQMQAILNGVFGAHATLALPVWVSALDQTDAAALGGTRSTGYSPAAAMLGAFWTTVRTSTAAQFRYRLGSSDASTLVLMGTLGWIDTRGQLQA